MALRTRVSRIETDTTYYCGRCCSLLLDARDATCSHCSLELRGAGRFQRIPGRPPRTPSGFWWVEAV